MIRSQRRGLVWFEQEIRFNGSVIPSETLSLTEQGVAYGPLYIAIPHESLSLTEQTPGYVANIAIIPAIPLTLSWGGFTLAYEADSPVIALELSPLELTWSLGKQIPAASLALTTLRPQAIYEPTASQPARYVYRCYLTGDKESPPITDLELPMASFQSRRRNGEQTYLSVIIPNPTPYIDGINARINGDIVIYSGFAVGDTETITELLRVNFGNFRYDLGARSGSAQLIGHKQVTYTSPKTRALSGVSYQSVTDGVIRVRCEPDMWLNPGDTADINGNTFVVDSLAYFVKPTLATMEVQEVAA
jgi:hypothetical protein